MPSANQIVLDVVVDTRKATADVKTFGATTKRQVQQIGTSAVPNLKKVETSTQSMGKSMAGAGAAISSANGALMLMGRQGPPALQTVATGAASLAVSGFGPLGLAITAATVGISLMASKWGDAGTEASEATKKMVDGLHDAERALRQLQIAEIAKRLGLSTTELTAGDELLAARGRLSVASIGHDQTRSEIERGEQRRALINKGVHASEIAMVEQSNRKIDARLSLLRKTAEEERQILEPLRREVELRERALKLLRSQELERRAASVNVKAARGGSVGFPSLRGGGPGMGSGIPLGGARGLSGNTVFGSGVANESMRQMQLDAAEDERLQQLLSDQRASDMARARELALIDSKRGVGVGVSGGESSALEQDAQNRARSFAEAASSQLSMALQTQDWTSAAQGFAQATSSALMDAIAAGFIESTGVKKAASSAFESIGSAFAGGA